MHVTRSHMHVTSNAIYIHCFGLCYLLLLAVAVASAFFSERARAESIKLLRTHDGWSQWTVYSHYKQQWTSNFFYIQTINDTIYVSFCCTLFIYSIFFSCSVRVSVCACNKREKVYIFASDFVFVLWGIFPRFHTIRFLYIISFEFDSIYMLRI